MKLTSPANLKLVQTPAYKPIQLQVEKKKKILRKIKEIYKNEKNYIIFY